MRSQQVLPCCLVVTIAFLPITIAGCNATSPDDAKAYLRATIAKSESIELTFEGPPAVLRIEDPDRIQAIASAIPEVTRVGRGDLRPAAEVVRLKCRTADGEITNLECYDSGVFVLNDQADPLIIFLASNALKKALQASRDIADRKERQ